MTKCCACQIGQCKGPKYCACHAERKRYLDATHVAKRNVIVIIRARESTSHQNNTERTQLQPPDLQSYTRLLRDALGKKPCGTVASSESWVNISLPKPRLSETVQLEIRSLPQLKRGSPSSLTSTLERTRAVYVGGTGVCLSGNSLEKVSKIMSKFKDRLVVYFCHPNALLQRSGLVSCSCCWNDLVSKSLEMWWHIPSQWKMDPSLFVEKGGWDSFSSSVV